MRSCSASSSPSDRVRTPRRPGGDCVCLGTEWVRVKCLVVRGALQDERSPEQAMRPALRWRGGVGELCIHRKIGACRGERGGRRARDRARRRGDTGMGSCGVEVRCVQRSWSVHDVIAPRSNESCTAPSSSSGSDGWSWVVGRTYSEALRARWRGRGRASRGSRPGDWRSR